MKIGALIPARGGSKRVPRKNLKVLCGKPLIYWTITAAKHSKYIDKVWVSSEDAEILKVAENYGADIIKRPKRLATDTVLTEPVIEHFLKKVDLDVLVLIEPTHPLLTTKDIDIALKKFLNDDYDSLITLENRKLFMWGIEGNYAYPIDHPLNYKHRQRTQKYKGVYVESPGLWITKTRQFKKTKSRVSGLIGYYVIPHMCIDIDYELDFRLCETILRGCIHPDDY